MSDHTTKKKTPAAPRSYGWMAEYTDEDALLEGARKVRDSGYTKTDAFVPFPVHGIDVALGIKPTILPFIVLCAGFTGLATALVLQWWTNAYDYPYIISGKPMASWPAFIPVTFELTILFSAFTTFFAMIFLNRLPRFSHPVFTNPRFDQVTNDRFFLYVDASDKYYNRESVKELLSATHAESVDEVMDDHTPSAMPRVVWLGLACLIAAAMIPPAMIASMRSSKSEKSRWHVFFDMDFQPKKKAQQPTTIFADGRTARPQVAGTVARGQFEQVDSFYLGYDPDKRLAMDEPEKSHLVSALQNSEPAGSTPDAAHAVPAIPPAAGLNLPFIAEIPIGVDEELMRLGKKKYDINCAVCHGLGGDGDGLVARRADQLAQGYWLAPTSMHDPRIRKQPVGQIYYTISNGKGKMATYAGVLTPRERWAVVAYVSALQRSRHASIEDVPADMQEALKIAP